MFKKKDPLKPRNVAAGLSKAATVLLLLFVLFFVLGGSFYTIKEEEQAVVCTFGTPKAVTTPGLHFKIPFAQTVTKVNTTIQGFDIGYSMNGHG